MSAGLEWALSDNVRTIMYEHWSRLDGYTPPLPVDRWPVAYRLGGLGVILFEVTFVVLLFGRRTRAFAVVTGLVFHNMNYLFLRLGFFTIQICYVAFVPWERFLHRLGSWQTRLEVLQATGRARRLVGAIRVVDVFGVVEVGEGAGPPRVQAGDRDAQGWAAVRLLVRRVPTLWPLLPVVYAVPTATGEGWLAGCPEPRARALQQPPAAPGAPRSVTCVAMVIIGGNALAGVGAVTAAWPFACYPTFAGIAHTTRAELALVLDRPDGARLKLDAAALRQIVSWEKFDGMARPILLANEQARGRAAALIDTLVNAGVDVPAGTSVEVYRATVSLDPDADGAENLKLLFRLER